MELEQHQSNRHIVEIVSEHTKVLFSNLYAQIEKCDLAFPVDKIPNCRYIYHAIHSMDKYFINPDDFIEPDSSVCGVASHLSIVSDKRSGYVHDTTTIISREQLSRYASHVEQKIMSYLKNLTDGMLCEKVGNNGEYTRLGLILSQFRHFMWHMGMSSAATFLQDGTWPQYFGYD